MKTHSFQTEREWLQWFADAERAATPAPRHTPRLERKWITGRETASSKVKLYYSTPIPIRVKP